MKLKYRRYTDAPVEELRSIYDHNMEVISNRSRLMLAVALCAPFAGLIVGAVLAWLGGRP